MAKLKKPQKGNRYGVRTPEAEQRRIDKRRESRNSAHDIGQQVFQWGAYKNGRPKPYNPTRRNKYVRDLAGWLKTYMPDAFPLEFSDDHLRVIAKIKRCVLEGEKFTESMPRGFGKTTIAQGAVTWALGYGHRQFPVILGSQKDAAVDILHALIEELEANELIQADFPELALPFAALEGKAAKCRFQLCNGERTHIKMTTDKIECARIPGSPSSGSIVGTMGLTGRVRGPRKRLPDGSYKRPDFVIPDDPQTDESAASKTQTDSREGLITGAVLGMGSHGEEIALVMPCTVIEKDDFSDRMLDTERHPEFQGERLSILYQWPENWSYWEHYINLRRHGLAEGDGGREATEYYKANREVMDAGARVAWSENYNLDELSALQHAINLYCDRGEESFYSEYMNMPKSEAQKHYYIDYSIVASRVNGYPLRTAPDSNVAITGHIDIGQTGLYWTLLATQQDMTAYVLDYGRYPPHGKLFEENETESRARKAIYNGLVTLTQQIAQFHVAAKGGRNIDLLLIDCGRWTDTVFRFYKNNEAPVPVMPSWGCGNVQMRRKSYKRSVNFGDECHETIYQSQDSGHVIEHNADWWRVALQKAFLEVPGTHGSVSMYGSDTKQHEDYARHIAGEYLQEIKEENGINKYVWNQVTGQAHDWLDTCVGAWVAANVKYRAFTFGGLNKLAGKKKRRRKPIIEPEE